MGFFDSKSSIDQTTKYDNPELRAYTTQYRGASPWGFATLDPTATLAAMGGGTKLGGKNLGSEFKEYLKGLSADEKKERMASQEALQRIRERQESGQFLTEQETTFINDSLDKAFAFAQKTGYADWEKATQMMAGSRGMRMSDTPVADPALRELRNFELGLGSERARMGLGATLDFSRNQQAFDQAFMEFNKTLEANRWSTRQGFLFGGGLQAAGNLGSITQQKGTFTQGKSGFDQAMGALEMVGKVGSIAGSFYTGGMTGGLTNLSSMSKAGKG